MHGVKIGEIVDYILKDFGSLLSMVGLERKKIDGTWYHSYRLFSQAVSVNLLHIHFHRRPPPLNHLEFFCWMVWGQRPTVCILLGRREATASISSSYNIPCMQVSKKIVVINLICSLEMEYECMPKVCGAS